MRFEDLLGSRYFFNGENSSDLDISVLQESDTGDACNSFTPEVAEKWAFTFSRYWISFKPKDRKIPNSGWKIHVSLQLEELHHDLPVLVNLLLAKGIPFKHVRGTKMYRLLLDKNSDRRQCGKAVTIYPNVDEIPSLIDTLKEVNFSPGPTVITDLPTYVNGISLRYGLFKPEKNTNTDSKVSRFEDNRRALDPATYDIESCPNEIREVLDISPRKSLPIRNAKALKQCGAGGVYSAQYKEGRVIIKQGRRFTGYDDTCSDGAHRVEREFKILRRLSTHNLDISPKVLNYVSSENETFLFLENIEGVSLHEWKRENYPLYAVNRIDYEQYLVSVKHIVSKLLDAIEKLHQVLLSHNDIHTRNIMWDAPQSGLRLIDFESCQHAQDLDDTYSPKAAGYYRNGLTDGFESDWYGASQVLQELIFSNVTHLDMDKSGVHKGWTRGYIGIKNSSPNLWEELKETFTELRKRSGQIVDFQIVNNTSNQSPQSTKGAISLLKSHNLTDSIYPHQIETEPNSLLFGPHSNWRQLPQSGATTLTGKNWSSRNLLQVAIEPGGLIASGYLDSLLAEYFLHPGKNGVANRQTWSSKVLRIVESVLADRDLISASANTEAVKNAGIPFHTGLVYGYLSYAFPISRLIVHGNLSKQHESMSLAALRSLILRELAEYVDSPDSGLQAKVSGRLLPYLATGSAGFGPVLSGLSKYREVLNIDNQVKQLLIASTPLTCNSMGLFNGYAGLAIGARLLSNYLSKEYDSDAAIDQLFAMSMDVSTGNRHTEDLLPSSDGGYRISTDFATGTLGVDFAVNFLSSPNMVPLSFTEFAKSIFPRGN